jgi:hypothetical protein
VKAIFLRMSATWKALRMVDSMRFALSGAGARRDRLPERPILVDGSAHDAG